MKKHISKIPFVILFIDIFLIVASCLTGCYYFDIANKYYLYAVTLFYLICGVSILYLKDNYRLSTSHKITPKTTYLLFEGIVLANIPLLFLLFFVSDKFNLIKFIGLNIVLSFVLIYIFRIILNFYMYKMRKIKNVLVLGKDDKISGIIKSKISLGWQIVYVLNDYSDNIHKILKDNNISIIINTIREPNEELMTSIIENTENNIKLYDITEIYEKVLNKYYIDDLSIRELFYHYINHRSKIYDFCKRIFDIISASIILIVTLPITTYIAIRVKLTDGASPLFTQQRMGKNKTIFNCYKLRTMYVNNYVPKNASDVKYAGTIDDDDRIIPFCKFARKARFDEIPQMLNILKGEMSIVAPRAEWINEANIFLKEVPFYACRMWVKTGWTGWGHINIPPCFTVDDEKERLAHDLYFIKKRNVFWEIGILIKAVFLAISGRHK